MDGQRVMIVKGAVDVLLNRMDFVWDGARRKFTEEDRERIEAQNLEFSQNGLRVLAFAYKEIQEERELSLDDEEGLTFLGLVAMMDPPREESKEAVSRCIQAGIKPVMITGDHKITAAAIADRKSVV